MKIEAGNYYRTRAGRKVLVLSTNGCADFPIYASLVLHTGKLDQPGCWRADGRFVNASTIHDKDLVAEWVDKPEFDWSVIPPWLNYLAMDHDGAWYLFEQKPALFRDLEWDSNGGALHRIPSKFAPTWTGRPEDSLVERNPAK